MEKHSYTGKTKEEAIQKAITDLQEVTENLFIRELENEKTGLFKSKKVEIEVIEKREVRDNIKRILIKILKDMGFETTIEIKNKNEVPTYEIYSDNDALLIGKNGKNLQALSVIVHQIIKKEINHEYKFLLDVNSYREKRDHILEKLARKIAKEVVDTQIEVKLDSMNSYERRIIHNALANNKKVFTESTGEEPNRHVVIKPVEK